MDTVEASVDGGQSWRAGRPGQGSPSLLVRPWSYQFVPVAGRHVVMVKATNRLVKSQPRKPISNPPAITTTRCRPFRSMRRDREETIRALMMLAALLIAAPAGPANRTSS